MLKSQIGLIIRVLLLALSAPIAAMLTFVDLDRDAMLLVIDLNSASVWLGGIVWAAITGGTFGLSRLVKASGGVT